MPCAVGIDLGTTYSCVAAVLNGKVEVIASDNGSRTTASCVAFIEGEKNELVGDSALTQAARNPANTIVEAKRLIGRHFNDESLVADVAKWPYAVSEKNGRPIITVSHNDKTEHFSPQEISAMVLKKIKADAEAYLGDFVTDAVITIPAYFSESQRRATREAGKLAGLNVLHLLPEPTAAAVAYGVKRPSREPRNVLIYDLGGGTFDVSIVHVTHRNFRVKAVSGISHLGGTDFDHAILQHVLEEIERRLPGADVHKDPRRTRRLLTLCERAKRQLSALTKFNIDVSSVVFDDLVIPLKRTEFDELCLDLLERTAQTVKATLVSAKLSATAIDEVILVGGSTRMPCVERLLAKLFPGKPISKTINPDEAVAHGAALLAAHKSGDTSAFLQGLSVQNVLPLSIGVCVGGGEMEVVIPRNHAIPTRKVVSALQTDFKDQTAVAFPVYQGERRVAARNRFVGQFVLEDLPDGPAGRPLDLALSIDEDGILTVEAKLRSARNWEGCTLRLEDVAAVDVITNVEDADRYREEDDRELQRLQAKRRLEMFLENESDDVPLQNKRAFKETQLWCEHNDDATLETYRDKLAEAKRLRKTE